MSPSVAVIDIGSNSIKVLIATRAADRSITPLKIRTVDARISAGISRSTPRLSEDGMAVGLDAIRTLLADVELFRPKQVMLVATSAVRDALNGGEFRDRVQAATGHRIRVLSGEEEAGLIGRGLTCDPALGELRDFYVFDLGGGSLECLAFRARRIEQAISLPLGCVRLTERFVIDRTAPLSAEAKSTIAAHTRELVAQSGFQFNLPSTAVAVGTGGTVATVRAILGARTGLGFEQTSPIVTVEELRDLLKRLSALPLELRKQITGLPPARADIFPAALVTLIAVAERGGFAAFRNSIYNLRYGIADEALA
jgi:exopolyphosphatase / guanosine-5'-triphosphate,3'-diphosphate pyrophosphatase